MKERCESASLFLLLNDFFRPNKIGLFIENVIDVRAGCRCWMANNTNEFK